MKRPVWIIPLAIWEFINCPGAFLGLMFGMFAEDMPIIIRIGLALLIPLFWLTLSIAAGIGLIVGKEWGRILAIVHSVIGLVFVPVSTVIGILALIYLTRAETKQYFQPAPKATPSA